MKKVGCRTDIAKASRALTLASKDAMAKSLMFRSGDLPVHQYALSLRVCGNAYLAVAEKLILNEEDLERVRLDIFCSQPEGVEKP
jgi:hypothetical protein